MVPARGLPKASTDRGCLSDLRALPALATSGFLTF